MKPAKSPSPAAPASPGLKYPLPPKAVQALLAYQDKAPQNAGLLFERYVPDTSQSADAKKEALKLVKAAAQRADRNLLQALLQRWEELAKATQAQPFSLKTEWRLISGLGRKGPLEVGFTFNRYGFPILPGSSLKGIARAWGFYQLAEALSAADLGELDQLLCMDEEKFQTEFLHRFPAAGQELHHQVAQFRTIFGTPTKAGRAVFLDALPAKLPQLDLDIMNPHYPDYYQGKEFPTNWQSPVPVYFLTVADNTEFCFAVGWHGQLNELLRDLAKMWLIQGLTQLGAGAKTSAGYGYFVSIRPLPSTQPQVGSQHQGVPNPDRDTANIQTSVGKVKYENGKPFIVDLRDPSLSFRVHWGALRMNALPAKTPVKYTYQIYSDGRREIISIERTFPA